MPSPFPGMDPFIEDQRWEDFHHEFITDIRAALVPRARPRYVVEVEERVYLERQPPESPRLIIPDVAVAEAAGAAEAPAGGVAVATAVEIAPITLTLPMPERRREYYLTLRDRRIGNVVTVIEVLSPWNKQRGSDGRQEYLRKREDVLLSDAHLVELDLLRGGERLPTVEPLPPGDYYTFVCREPERPKAEVYAWRLPQRLPAIPIPLAGDDPDITLDLQEVLAIAYDRAGYDYALDYRRPVEPSLREVDAAWAQQILVEARIL